jgi:long-chain acyl-CoA synthetase
MSVFDALTHAAGQFGKNEAIVFGQQAFTYGELYQSVRRLSSALKKRGDIQPGDRIALFLPNRPEFVAAYYAVVGAGAIAASLNVMLKRDEVQFILNDCEAKILITTRELLERLPESSAIPSVAQIVCARGGSGPGIVGFEELLSQGSDGNLGGVVENNSGAAILYTSGTTGTPKGVLLTHGNLVSNTAATIYHTKMTSDDRLICYLPLFHCFGQNFIMNACVRSGATLILHERFHPDEILESIRTNRVSMFFGVPAVYTRLLTLPDLRGYFGAVRYCFSAAAPMPVTIARRWREATGHTIFEGYGLTETSPFASYNHDSEYREGSVGTAIQDVELKVFDPTGAALSPGEIGEIGIKGPNVMQGYFRRPAETAEVLRDGWFLTGDIGKMDEDGYIYVVDRAKDMINVSGFKVWPREVEEVLVQHPGVAEVAVVGFPDVVAGEIVKAFIVVKENGTINEQELIHFCRSHMAVYKAPRIVEFIDALPKNPSGKILKRELRARDRRKEDRPSHAA